MDLRVSNIVFIVQDSYHHKHHWSNTESLSFLISVCVLIKSLLNKPLIKIIYDSLNIPRIKPLNIHLVYRIISQKGPSLLILDLSPGHYQLFKIIFLIIFITELWVTFWLTEYFFNNTIKILRQITQCKTTTLKIIHLKFLPDTQVVWPPSTAEAERAATSTCRIISSQGDKNTEPFSPLVQISYYLFS